MKPKKAIVNDNKQSRKFVRNFETSALEKTAKTTPATPASGGAAAIRERKD
ncbi:hypothetical protein [Variovorax sp. HJSM1_2]|uniref:hypothetical protein n=1 Tax=Variovorax sp. HJSM1_2 TaxID=3366263 RepID=UPI003BD6FE0F